MSVATDDGYFCRWQCSAVFNMKGELTDPNRTALKDWWDLITTGTKCSLGQLHVR